MMKTYLYLLFCPGKALKNDYSYSKNMHIISIFIAVCTRITYLRLDQWTNNMMIGDVVLAISTSLLTTLATSKLLAIIYMGYFERDGLPCALWELQCFSGILLLISLLFRNYYGSVALKFFISMITSFLFVNISIRYFLISIPPSLFAMFAFFLIHFYTMLFLK